MEISRFRESGALSTRSMVESLVLHAILLALLLLLGASVLLPGHTDRGPASSVKGDHRAGSKTEALGSSKRAWETGTPSRSGKGLFRGAEAA